MTCSQIENTGNTKSRVASIHGNRKEFINPHQALRKPIILETYAVISMSYFRSLLINVYSNDYQQSWWIYMTQHSRSRTLQPPWVWDTHSFKLLPLFFVISSNVYASPYPNFHPCISNECTRPIVIYNLHVWWLCRAELTIAALNSLIWLKQTSKPSVYVPPPNAFPPCWLHFKT